MSKKDFKQAFDPARRSRIKQEQARVQRWISVGFVIGGGIVGCVLIVLGYGAGYALGWW